MTWLAWRHVTPEVVSGLLKSSARIGLRAGAILALVCVVVALWRTAHALPAPTPYPAWAAGVSWKPVAAWYGLSGVALVADTASGLFFAILAAVLFTPAAMFYGFQRGLKTWWLEASASLATPTRDSGVVYEHRADRDCPRACCRHPGCHSGRADGLHAGRPDCPGPYSASRRGSPATGRSSSRCSRSGPSPARPGAGGSQGSARAQGGGCAGSSTTSSGFRGGSGSFDAAGCRASQPGTGSSGGRPRDSGRARGCVASRSACPPETQGQV